MKHLDKPGSLRDLPDDVQLDEFVLRCATDVAAVRQTTAVPARHHVTVVAGNVCDRGEPLGDLQTSVLTAHTVTGIGARPVMVGSVFQLRFDRSSLNVPPALAVCERCTMLGESSFELRLRFAQPIDLAHSHA